MRQGFFITGTDTNVGKTWTTVALMRHFKATGRSVLGLKPVASGCEWVNGKLLNSDALLLQKHASFQLDYDLINPYAFELPVSPHIAGGNNQANIDKLIVNFNLIKDQADIILVEGAGGWYSPITDTCANSGLAKALNLPVLLVVAIKLGCINHAMLTYQAIIRDGSNCAGWIAVHAEQDVLASDEIMATLTSMLKPPLVGNLPHQSSADKAALTITLQDF